MRHNLGSWGRDSMLSSQRKGWISLQPGVFMGTPGQWLSFRCEFNVYASVCFLRAETAPDEKSDGKKTAWSWLGRVQVDFLPHCWVVSIGRCCVWLRMGHAPQTADKRSRFCVPHPFRVPDPLCPQPSWSLPSGTALCCSSCTVQVMLGDKRKGCSENWDVLSKPSDLCCLPGGQEWPGLGGAEQSSLSSEQQNGKV